MKSITTLEAAFESQGCNFPKNVIPGDLKKPKMTFITTYRSEGISYLLFHQLHNLKKIFILLVTILFSHP